MKRIMAVCLLSLIHIYGGERETLNNDDNISARAIIDEYEDYDMPFGWFLPNDGYGCGYGQTDSFQGDIDHLQAFAAYALSKGVQTVLWTHANLWPADQDNPCLLYTSNE